MSPDAPFLPQMYIPVDPFDAKYQKLGDLYKEVLKNSSQPEEGKPLPPYNALTVPSDNEGRNTLIKRLLELFEASSKANFDSEEFELVMVSLRDAMPDPVEYPEDFPAFVQNRTAGVLEMLRLVVLMQSNRLRVPKEKIIESAVMLGTDHLEDGRPTPLNDLATKVRVGVMSERVRSIAFTSQAYRETRNLEDTNIANHRNLTVRFTMAKLKEPFNLAVTAYRDNVDRFTADETVPEYARAQWLYVLFNKMNILLDAKTVDAEKRLIDLAQNLTSAPDKTLFQETINKFAQ